MTALITAVCFGFCAVVLAVMAGVSLEKWNAAQRAHREAPGFLYAPLYLLLLSIACIGLVIWSVTP